MMSEENESKITKELVEEVRKACIQAAREGFQEASMSGLCTEGAIEAAIGSIQSLDLSEFVDEESTTKDR